MKKLNKLAVLLAILITAFFAPAALAQVGGGGGGSGGGAITEIPIASEEMLDGYAMSLITQVRIFASASSSIGSFYQSAPYLGKIADPVALKKLGESITPKLTLANPKDDAVNYYVSYDGSAGKVFVYDLFYGSDSKKPVVGKGGWTLPAFQAVLNRSNRVPFPIKGLRYAYMTIRDETGKVIDYLFFDESDQTIDRNRGVLFLGSQHLNRIGELYVTRVDDNGKEVTDSFNAATGKHITPEEVVSDGVTVDFPRLKTLPQDTDVIAFKAVEGNPKMFYVEYAKNVFVSISYTSPSGTPVQIFVIDAEDLREDPTGWHQIDPGLHPIEAGRRLFIRFDWGEKNTSPIYRPPTPVGVGVGKSIN